MSEKTNLKVSGSTHIAGGEYAEVRCSGSLKVDSHLSCEDLHASGSVKIGGDLRCDSLRASGSMHVNGTLDCAGELACSGSLHIDGGVNIGKGRCSGSLHCGGDLACAGRLSASSGVKIGGDLRTEEGEFSGACSVGGTLRAGILRCSGALLADRDVEAEQFYSKGALDIRGLLNAEYAEIKACGEVGDIGGSTILVRDAFEGSRFMQIAIRGRHVSSLRVNTIEGDNIELERTQAKVVRGKRVRIGKDCEIDRVEYSEDLTVEDGGIVRERVEI